MNEGAEGRKSGKSGGPKASKKPKAGGTKSEGADSVIGNTIAIGTHSEINKSDIENPASEIIEPLTTHNSPLTTMEVHHHPEVERKGLKEYLLEGLMIFLAVTMGFFAESLREHINENKKAKEYAVTLYSDLKLDTAELGRYLTYFRYATANTDTLMKLLSAADPKQIPSGKLYWFGLFGGAHSIFTPHDATLVEMKSSGSLRFFGDKVISRKLALYDQLCKGMKSREDNETLIYSEVRKARAQIFEFKYNEQANDIYQELKTGTAKANREPFGMQVASKQTKIDSFKKTNPPLLTYDKTLFNEYVEMVRSRFLYVKVESADTLKRSATELIGLLKKKYGVQDE